MNLTFDATAHAYQINGSAVPNVTRVLGDLFDWSAIPPGLLDRKRQIGTAVHKAIELDVEDDLDESSIDPQALGYFDAWRRFCREKRFTCQLTEKRIASESFRYAGTLDLSGDMGGVDALIDIKIAAQLHPATALQTAAYHHAAVEMRLIRKTARRFALLLQPDGAYRIEPHQNKSDFPVFLSCLSRHNWRVANRLLKETQP